MSATIFFRFLYAHRSPSEKITKKVATGCSVRNANWKEGGLFFELFGRAALAHRASAAKKSGGELPAENVIAARCAWRAARTTRWRSSRSRFSQPARDLRDSEETPKKIRRLQTGWRMPQSGANCFSPKIPLLNRESPVLISS